MYILLGIYKREHTKQLTARSKTEKKKKQNKIRNTKPELKKNQQKQNFSRERNAITIRL